MCKNMKNFKKVTNEILDTHAGHLLNENNKKTRTCKCNLEIVSDENKIDSKKYLKNAGITLIALVITIIVLLILAGISIATLTGDNGILTQAKNAKNETIIAREKEQVQLAYNASITKKNGDTSISSSELQAELDDLVGKDSTKVTGGKILKICFNDTNNMYKISGDKTISEYTRAEVTPVYAFLCDTDGDDEGETLVLSSTENIDGYKIVKSYGVQEKNCNPTQNVWNFGDDKEKITKAIIYDKIAPTTTYCWFNGLKKLTEIQNIQNLDTSSDTNMNYMFDECRALVQLDLSSFDTSNVTNMSSMFDECNALVQLDLSNFDTSNVTDMYRMFGRCNALVQLDLSSFDTSNVTSMSDMFRDCIRLKKLDLSSFDTSNVTSMSDMFRECRDLVQLDLSKFDTTNVTDMNDMFIRCNALVQLDLSNFDTSNVTDMGGMFSDCFNLAQLDVSNFDTSNVRKMGSMFSSCNCLKKLDLSSFVTPKVTEMYYMFANCSSLTELDLSNFDTSSVTSMECMFQYCGVNKIYVSEKWKIKESCKGQEMFEYCSKLEGGSGTKYDSNYVGVEYAHIDEGTSNPGYLTKKDN